MEGKNIVSSAIKFKYPYNVISTMKKLAILIVALATLAILLTGCGSDTQGKRVATPEISGMTTVDTKAEPATLTGETGKTAAEALKELESIESAPSTENNQKEGTFYPPVVTDKTGEDALKEKTRALFQKPVYDPGVEADDDFGPRYGDASNN
jgi:PBP1b-binding outer membrane lipoprotein LpoB